MEIDAAIQQVREQLLGDLLPEGRWDGRLSDSALATAVAAFALKMGGRTELAERGFTWLKNHRNTDGGWGDSPESPSNFTTTLLCRCVLDEVTESPAEISAKVLEFYGSDRTFSVPILTMCMLAGKLGDDWSILPQLPFELAVFPHRFYKFLQLPVVSYALPALIAIGVVRHKNRPTKLFFYREALVPRVLEILKSIQPESGGFLEAAPLTGFVVMSLIGAGFGDHPVAQAGLDFLENTMRAEGCWPIDVNLSTWVTSLAVRALDDDLSAEQKERIRTHLIATQWREEHPFTHSAPGGWGWTHTAGAVPDADDTSAALLALRRLGQTGRSAPHAAVACQWLLDLQNRDGGMPTFCKGWGKLPFDRSCPDLTAHAIRAFWAWRLDVDYPLQLKMEKAIRRGLRYLQKQQRDDGTWLPLWFGSQTDPNHENPVYGTVRVLEALQELDETEFPEIAEMQMRGRCGLEQIPPEKLSLEELALRAGLTGQGIENLLGKITNNFSLSASPIGLYFASLWYSEKLYPRIFALEALKKFKLEKLK